MSATGNIMDAQDNEIIKLNKQLKAYQHAINSIDDYFEYANESTVDRDKIHVILDSLTINLSIIK